MYLFIIVLWEYVSTLTGHTFQLLIARVVIYGAVCLAIRWVLLLFAFAGEQRRARKRKAKKAIELVKW